MATPPRPSRLEVGAALERIRARHDRVEDPHRDQLGEEPRDVLAYLRRRSGSLPRAVAADDVWDELVLHAALRWEDIDRERALLRRARHLGLSLSELAAHHGIRTRQGMQDHLDRLDALVDVGTPDVHLTRAARRREKARPADQRWLDTHHHEVLDGLRALVHQVDRALFRADTGEGADAELEWLDELRADVDDDALSPATLGLLGLLLGELRPRPEVGTLDRAHGLHRAMRSCERLRSWWEAARSGGSGA